MKYTIFDCETRARSASDLASVIPQFSAPSNYKDPEKIHANIAEQTEKWIERAALSPLTGEIICIGLMQGNSFSVLEGEEKSLLRLFCEHVRSSDLPLIGWNICGFDLPFIQKRCFFHGLKPPFPMSFDYYRQDRIVDLMYLWGNRNKNEFTGLNTAARFLRVGEKSGEGKDFASLWERERGAALAYLETDCKLVQKIAERMGVVEEDGDKPAF